MKKGSFLISILVLAVLIFTGCAKPPCYDCGAGNKGDWKSCHKSEHGCPFEECFLKAPCLAVKKKDELGLSEDQVSKIKDLCAATKKEHIQLEADIEKAFVDIKGKMHEDVLDVAGVHALIDKKYDLKKKKSKALISSFGKLTNDILTEDQRAKFKEFKDKCKDGCCKSKCSKSSKCPCSKDKKE